MANQEHLDILKQGVKIWNEWRAQHKNIEPDLRKVDLRGADLRKVDLSEAHLREANFSQANLNQANLSEARLYKADLSKAILTHVNLSRANLTNANLREADLSGANLDRAILVKTNLTEATLTGCYIYGISAWNVQLDGAEQKNLVITPEEEPTITVDNLEVAQFIYLLLNNPKIRDVINTIGQRGVLIIGRFQR